MNRLLKALKRCAIATGTTFLMVAPSLSDDIDVYVAPPPEATVGQTLVVFTLDLRPNVMASTVCNGGECDALFTEVGMSTALDGDVSFFELLVAVLKKVLGDIDSHKIKVALMIPHADTTGGNKDCVGFLGKNVIPECSNGAYVLSGFKSTGDNPDTLLVDESNELDDFFARLESIPLKDGGNWDHDYQLKELFFEMFRFVSAGPIFNSENGLDNFGTSSEYNISHAADTESVNPLVPEPEAELMWDPDAVEPNSKVYINSLDGAEHCTSIFSVNITFANANKDADSDTAIAQDAPLGFGFSPDNNQRGRLQVLEYLANTDLSPDPETETDTGLVGNQNITSYFVTRKGGRAVSTANDWAQAGGTGSALTYEDDPEVLVRLISGLFNEIEGVSTTFVAASVPANVFNRAETLNEVFLAIFEPDENQGPFWVGNVKKLTTTTIDETICEDTNNDGDTLDPGECRVEDRKILVDVLEAGETDPVSAINPLDGRIRSGALTYWTQTGSNDEYLPAPTTDEEEKEFTEGTDGRGVNRGGAGQVKPGYLGSNSPGNSNDASSDTTMSGPRKVFTEPDDGTAGTSDAMVALDADTESFATAVELLTDDRPYPGTSLTYGAVLYQTVMSDCEDCASSYVDETSGGDQNTAEERVNNLIRFARGWDVGLDSDPEATVDKRDWWQSDPLHNRPLALNYGARAGYTTDRPDIRVIVAGNDGVVQMIRDGRKSDNAEDGVEAWAFLPREFMPLQKRLLEGTTGLYNPGQPADPPHDPLHPYAMDGAPTALVIDNNRDGTIDTNDGDRVYLFMGQRRGGKRYYALDISDPDDPKFLWSIGKNDTGDEFAEMGQSWSLMRAGLMQVNESGVDKRRPVLVFGGGYNGDDYGDGYADLGKDSRVNNHNSNTEILGTDDAEGNALFIVNALSGELIWKVVGPPNGVNTDIYDPVDRTLEHADLLDSVAAPPTTVDGNGDGLIDRVYFADTGGNVWRLDAAVSERTDWEVNKLFAGGRHVTGQEDNDNDRRFFNAPDVVFASDDTGNFDAVLLGSGDRAHPLGDVVENWFYMIKDRNTNSGEPPTSILTHDDLADLTDNCLQEDPDDFSGCADTSAVTNIANGWKVQFEQCEAGGDDPKCGEKALASPLTIEGTVFFTSYLPVLGASSTAAIPDTCGTKEGGGLFYAVDLQTAAGVLDFSPSNDSGGVDTPDRFDRLASPGIPPEVVAISPEEVLRPDLEIQKTKGRKSSETFWYNRKFD